MENSSVPTWPDDHSYRYALLCFSVLGRPSSFLSGSWPIFCCGIQLLEAPRPMSPILHFPPCRACLWPSLYYWLQCLTVLWSRRAEWLWLVECGPSLGLGLLWCPGMDFCISDSSRRRAMKLGSMGISVFIQTMGGKTENGKMLLAIATKFRPAVSLCLPMFCSIVLNLWFRLCFPVWRFCIGQVSPWWWVRDAVCTGHLPSFKLGL